MSRRLKLLYFIPEEIINYMIQATHVIDLPVLTLPAGTIIVDGPRYCQEHNAWRIVLRNESWPEVSVGTIPPLLILEHKLNAVCAKCGVKIGYDIHTCPSKFASKVMGAIGGLVPADCNTVSVMLSPGYSYIHRREKEIDQHCEQLRQMNEGGQMNYDTPHETINNQVTLPCPLCNFGLIFSKEYNRLLCNHCGTSLVYDQETNILSPVTNPIALAIDANYEDVMDDPISHIQLSEMINNQMINFFCPFCKKSFAANPNADCITCTHCKRIQRKP